MNKDIIIKRIKIRKALNDIMPFIATLILFGSVVIAFIIISLKEKNMNKYIGIIIPFSLLLLLPIMVFILTEINRNKIKSNYQCNECKNILSEEIDYKIAISTNSCPYCGKNIKWE